MYVHKYSYNLKIVHLLRFFVCGFRIVSFPQFLPCWNSYFSWFKCLKHNFEMKSNPFLFTLFHSKMMNSGSNFTDQMYHQVFSKFLNALFLFMYTDAVCLCVTAMARKGCPFTLDLELQAAVSHLQWLLIAIAQLQWFSERPASAFNHWAISQAPPLFCDLDQC